MINAFKLKNNIEIFGVAGGGGSSSDYSGFSGSSYSTFDSDWGSSGYSSSLVPGWLSGVCVIVFLLFFAYAFIAIMFKNRKKDQPKLEQPNESDQISKPLYDLPTTSYRPEDLESKETISILEEKVKTVFLLYQQDWTNFNIVNMREYQTEKYYAHACLMLELLKSMHRQNIVSDIKIRDISIDANRLRKTDTTFLATIHFSCTDELRDIKDDKCLVRDKLTNYEETWEFVRDGKNDVRLNAIYQSAMMSFSHLTKDMQEFASANNLYYSPDWGRYALPDCGAIFDDASLRYSDVNNHVVGKWNDTLVQLYTYSRSPTEPGSYWLVGSLSVPKTYEGIIVRHRRAEGCAIPKGYECYQMEWGEFNQIFEVWSSDIDKIASFELVNPKFMAYLVDNELCFSLEVIGDHIYFFAHSRQFNKDNYAILLNILALAYRELKM